jgi:hypothetical protein
VWQAHVHDLSTGVRHQISDHPVGVVLAYASCDGASVIWWQDETGDESGAWLSRAAADGEQSPLLPGVPAGWNEGIARPRA